MTELLPPQMPAEAQHLTYALPSETQVKALVGVNISFSFLFNISMNLLYSMINSLQITAHLPLNNINMPINSLIVFDFIKGVVNFDLVEVFDIVELDLTVGSETEPFNDRFESLGYQTLSPVDSLGSINIFIVILIVQTILVVGSSIPFFICLKRFRGSGSKLISGTQRFFLEILLETTIASLIALVAGNEHPSLLQMQGKTPTDNFLITYALGLLSINAVLLFLVVYTSCFVAPGRAKRPKEKTWQSRYLQGLTDGFDESNRWASYFNIIFVVRRVLIVIIAMKLNAFPLAQMHLILFFSLLNLCFMWRVKPFNAVSLNIINIFNGLAEYICNLLALMVVMTRYQVDTCHTIGWILVFMVFITIFVGTLIMFVQTLSYLHQSFKRLRSKV